MHSFLITGGTKETRNKKIQDLLSEWHIKPYDEVELLPLEKEKDIGISEVRAFERRLTFSPQASPHLVGIIRNADTLTLPSQHALLKTLEEPPKKVKILVETGVPNTLLPTILSRMTFIHLSEKREKEALMDFPCDSKKNPGTCVAFTDTTFTSRPDALIWINKMLQTLQSRLEKNPSKKESERIKKLLEAREQLTANVNYKLVMDDVFFHIFD